ncbi:ankyrin repeat-containing domain protein [Lactarius akahatsu]|uniref:Ankyrin repeat-containing domain protein n=1 Tax=Lactarius akahatsu TaxID=416441 RepID=A0AAD4L6Q3_9AGAM|nr:ankyrin repeat-containing domain protein [Lactarius akahatsu]
MSFVMELKLVQLLLDHGANVNAKDNRGQTPLHQVLGSFEESDFPVVQLLVERGADVNAPDNDHQTPLHLASRLASLEVVWLLLKHGADINAANKKGQIPSQLARESIRKEINRSPPSEYPIGRRSQSVALMGLLSGYGY